MLRDVGIADQQKAQKQGRDDSIKQFSIQPHPTYLSTLKGIHGYPYRSYAWYKINDTLFRKLGWAPIASRPSTISR